MLSPLLQALQAWRQGAATEQTLGLPSTCQGALRGTSHAPCTARLGKGRTLSLAGSFSS